MTFIKWLLKCACLWFLCFEKSHVHIINETSLTLNFILEVNSKRTLRRAKLDWAWFSYMRERERLLYYNFIDLFCFPHISKDRKPKSLGTVHCGAYAFRIFTNQGLPDCLHTLCPNVCLVMSKSNMLMGRYLLLMDICLEHVQHRVRSKDIR